MIEGLCSDLCEASLRNCSLVSWLCPDTWVTMHRQDIFLCLCLLNFYESKLVFLGPWGESCPSVLSPRLWVSQAHDWALLMTKGSHSLRENLFLFFFPMSSLGHRMSGKNSNEHFSKRWTLKSLSTSHKSNSTHHPQYWGTCNRPTPSAAACRRRFHTHQDCSTLALGVTQLPLQPQLGKALGAPILSLLW